MFSDLQQQHLWYCQAFTICHKTNGTQKTNTCRWKQCNMHKVCSLYWNSNALMVHMNLSDHCPLQELASDTKFKVNCDKMRVTVLHNVWESMPGIFDLTTAMCILVRSTTGDRNLSKRKKEVTIEVLTMPRVNKLLYLESWSTTAVTRVLYCLHQVGHISPLLAGF